MPYKDIKKQNEASHRWYLKNKEKRAAYDKIRQQKKKSEISKQKKEYRLSPNGRAAYLLSSYNFNDKKYNRGKGDLTAKWIVEHILSQPCVHCGKEGWQVIGCNRIDNDKPHTMDNVEPCCKECNCKEYGIVSSKALVQLTLEWDFVKEWTSITEAAKTLHYNLGHIAACCRGERKSHKRFKWMYKSDYEKMLE